jgi:hypothetical protein
MTFKGQWFKPKRRGTVGELKQELARFEDHMEWSVFEEQRSGIEIRTGRNTWENIYDEEKEI